MQNSIDVGWLDVGVGEDSRLAVQDYGRLQRVVSQLSDQDNQYPSLCVFLGGEIKRHALQQLYPLNNIKRHKSEALIKLRYDIASLESRRPVLLADGDILHTDDFYPAKRLEAGVGHPISWDNHSGGKILLVLWSRLIFLFTDVVCIFIDDISSLERAAHFLVGCLELRSASTFPPQHLPRVIFIYGSTVEKGEVDKLDIGPISRRIHESGYDDLSGLFSSSMTIYLQDSHLSDTVQFQRLKASITEQVDDISSVRQEFQARPNGRHLTALFLLAIQHTLKDVANPFDFVTATRKDRPVSLCIEPHLTHYLEIGQRADFPLPGLANTIASALFMDHYVPNILATNPREVFRVLYRPAVIGAYHSSKAMWPDMCPVKETALVELYFSRLSNRSSQRQISAAELREEQLKSLSGRVFGVPVSGREYRFIIKGCLYCLYQRPLVVDVLPPTMSPTILAIDGGGVRGVIPLEFLLLVQEHLHPCSIQDVVALAVGTSSDYRIIRPDDIQDEPKVWRAARATAAAPFFFTPADLGVGSFQDGGLKYNFAGAIADQVSHQIWPTAIGSTRMLSLGTGKPQSNGQTPHFHHVFRDSFIRRGFDAWMSTMNTDNDWKKWRDHLSDSVKGDSHRLDVSLGDTPHAIDAIDAIEDYRNLVILQIGSGRMAREAATTMLISNFFFVVGSLPENTATPFWCHGSVRCKGPARKVVLALEHLYPDGLSYVSDGGLIDRFAGLDSICPSCGCYNSPISFLTRHLDYTVNIYLQSYSQKRWRLGGFPESVASFVSRQGLQSPFGQDDHGYPCRKPCPSCDIVPSPIKGTRRRRESRGSGDIGPRKRALV
ncbi:uncharacterized protein N7458_004337 [Penicillium daleae]|uniref:PNPLA domain-containing protein n=1 Tax=Penicillium daleae TaxID=63821 RepID=A0AAD6CA85_9EURO|nr:uncharacterized protein N7458_004337 [Penicillium daleae]KAJ5456073.1 hypothetical protein N7458_004337 [Penicillium daleae]